MPTTKQKRPWGTTTNFNLWAKGIWDCVGCFIFLPLLILERKTVVGTLVGIGVGIAILVCAGTAILIGISIGSG